MLILDRDDDMHEGHVEFNADCGRCTRTGTPGTANRKMGFQISTLEKGTRAPLIRVSRAYSSHATSSGFEPSLNLLLATALGHPTSRGLEVVDTGYASYQGIQTYGDVASYLGIPCRAPSG